MAKQAGLDITKPIAQQVNIAINEIGQILHQLKLQQKDAEELQNKINLLLNEKKKLEIQKTTADKAKVQADKDFYANEQHIHQLHEQKKAGERTAINLFTDLNAILANWMPGWQQDTYSTKNILCRDANEYADMKKSLIQLHNNYKQQRLQQSPSETQETKSSIYMPDGTLQPLLPLIHAVTSMMNGPGFILKLIQ